MLYNPVKKDILPHCHATASDILRTYQIKNEEKCFKYLANMSDVKSAANLLALVLKFDPFLTTYFLTMLNNSRMLHFYRITNE